MRVKELRVTGGLTQEELASRTGFFRTYISRIEAGLRNPTFDALRTLATALRVAPAVLFDPPTASLPKKVRAPARSDR